MIWFFIWCSFWLPEISCKLQEMTWRESSVSQPGSVLQRAQSIPWGNALQKPLKQRFSLCDNEFWYKVQKPCFPFVVVHWNKLLTYLAEINLFESSSEKIMECLIRGVVIASGFRCKSWGNKWVISLLYYYIIHLLDSQNGKGMERVLISIQLFQVIRRSIHSAAILGSLQNMSKSTMACHTINKQLKHVNIALVGL